MKQKSGLHPHNGRKPDKNGKTYGFAQQQHEKSEELGNWRGGGMVDAKLKWVRRDHQEVQL